MAAPKKLRAVAADETRAAGPMTVADAAQNGSARDELVALRAAIARKIDAPDIRGADMASLSRRLLEIRKDLSALDARAEQEASEDAIETEDGTFDAASV